MYSFNSQLSEHRLDIDSARMNNHNRNEVEEFPLRGFTAKDYFFLLSAHIVSSLVAIILYSFYTKGDTTVEVWIYLSVHMIIIGSVIVEGALLSTDNYFSTPSLFRNDFFLLTLNLVGCVVLFSAFLINMSGTTTVGLVVASLFSMVNYTLCALVVAVIVGKHI